MSEPVLHLPAPGGAVALGGKGASLARLMELGLPVPPAFVVAPAAYRAHAARLPPPPPDDAPAEALAAHRAALEAAPLEPALAAALEAALARLGPGPYAVRSSALAEDGAAHSFAGQHDTHLGVEPAGVAAAVRACWASLYNERAARYRAAAGGSDPAMAVVVQRMVPAEAAGVLFTCDPVRRRADRVVIEAVPGLGEALVSGHATPERWTFARPGLERLEHAPAAQPVLDEARARALAELGLRLEQAQGEPQDVEWALAGGELHLLQARPVTTPPQAGPLLAWTNTNAGELLPDVATPMTFSVIDGYVRSLLLTMLRPLGIDLAGHPIIGRVAGRVYFCLNTFVAMLRALPGAGRRNPAELFGGDKARTEAALARLGPADLPAVEVRPLRLLTGSMRMVAVMWHHRDVAPAGLLERARARTDAAAALDPAALDGPALAAHLEALGRDPFAVSEGLIASGVGLGAANGLAALCRRWLGDADGALCARLLSALGEMDSAEAGRAMWRLSVPARAPEVAASLADPSPWPERRARLASSEAGRAFLAALDAFLARHGHHARGELDVAVPRWSEEPEGVLASVRAYLARPHRGASQPDAETPEAVQARVAAERAALEADCRRRLGPLRRRLFDALLLRARRGFALRENIKSEAVRALAVLRRGLLAAGARLAGQGALAEPGDVFYLDLDELLAALRGAPAPGLRAQVARRRAELARMRLLSPPPVVLGELDEREARPAEAPVPPGDRLSGIAVSPGVAEGLARVILRADAAERVEPGEILVAPFTDPGWTPYFVAAAAVVVDLGGMLSHGSIVAREYGIPAVVNVGHGTRRIRTGQRLRVDGNRGEVVLLEGTGH